MSTRKRLRGFRVNIPAELRKDLSKKFARWAADVTNGAIEIIIEQGRDEKGPTPDKPYLVVGMTDVATPVTTPGSKFVEENGDLVEVISRHFVAEIDVQAVGDGGEGYLLWLEFPGYDERPNGLDVSEFNPTGTTDASRVFENAQEKIKLRSYPIRFKLVRKRTTDTSWFETAEITYSDEDGELL